MATLKASTVLKKDKAIFLIEALLRNVDLKDDECFGLLMKWFGEEGVITAKDFKDHFDTPKAVFQYWVSGFSIIPNGLRPAVLELMISKSREFFK